MDFTKALLCILALSFLAVQGYSQQGYLDSPAEDAAANSEIKNTMGSEAFFNRPVTETDASGPAAARASYAAASGAPANAVAGAWHLDLMDSGTRSLDLSIIQVDDAVFGRGSMAYGNGSEQVFASGKITSSGISLDIIPVAEVSLYRADLRLNGRAMSGSYKVYTPYGEPWTGIATGSIAA